MATILLALPSTSDENKKLFYCTYTFSEAVSSQPLEIIECNKAEKEK